MEVIQINGVPRTALGKKGTKADRNSGVIPCVLYGGKENVHFTTTVKDVRPLIYTPQFKLAEATIDGKVHKAILKTVQYHPASEAILHIDFLELTPGVPVMVDVPVTLIGQSPGVKLGGKLIQSMRRVKVKCTPETMVDHLDLSVSNLDLGQTNRVKNIIVPTGVEVMMSPSIPVALVEIPRALRSAQAEEKKGKK